MIAPFKPLLNDHQYQHFLAVDAIVYPCPNIDAGLTNKSPRYVGGDFVFLYWFVRRRRRRPQIFVHGTTSGQPF